MQRPVYRIEQKLCIEAESAAQTPAVWSRSLTFCRSLVLLALVLAELKFEVFHSSAHTFQHFERNPKLMIA
jgi:hypothetical protein